jgi:hypothetical protein
MTDRRDVRTTVARRRRESSARLGRPRTGVRADHVGKGLIRALDRVGSRSDRSPAVARKGAAASEQMLCGGCGAVFIKKTWRRSPRRLRDSMAAGGLPGVCPACRQMVTHQAFGRVVLQGAYVAIHGADLLRRIRNVAERAAFTQPERRIIGTAVRGATIEVLTTSQKLAHRIARELEKAFHGSASYHWSDGDGRLLAIWRRER